MRLFYSHFSFAIRGILRFINIFESGAWNKTKPLIKRFLHSCPPLSPISLTNGVCLSLNLAPFPVVFGTVPNKGTLVAFHFTMIEKIFSFLTLKANEVIKNKILIQNNSFSDFCSNEKTFLLLQFYLKPFYKVFFKK